MLSGDKTIPVDVCVVCALAEEAHAFLDVVTSECQATFEERMSQRHRYDYRCTTITNHKEEPLTLQVSWLPRYGPQEMVFHLAHVVEEFQPRLMLMTGICAGDQLSVHLGDLVVAERTFTYDSGAFVRDEHGRSVHQHDTLTYQIEENLLRFLRLFISWELRVAGLKRPPSEQKRHKVRCHIKPMASGSAVRRDYPFQEIQLPVRGAIAIDMEGAAFGWIMGSHPTIPWLIVKGVSDYANADKDDSYHDYAMYASALYALSFLQAYVTNERLPRQREQMSADAQIIKPGGVWISPQDGEGVEDHITFTAFAYPTNLDDPLIDHVNFTIGWHGYWQTASTIYPSDGSPVFTSDVALRHLHLSPGELQVSFDVYDQKGNKNLAPNGVRTVFYQPPE